MNSYVLAGYAIQIDGGGTPQSLDAATVEINVYASVTDFSYTIDSVIADDLPEVDIDLSALSVMVGESDILLQGDLINYSIGEITWNSGADTAQILKIDDTTTDRIYYFRIGGSEIPDFADLSEFVSFNSSLEAIGPIDAADPLGPGQAISLPGIPDVTLIEGPEVFGESGYFGYSDEYFITDAVGAAYDDLELGWHRGVGVDVDGDGDLEVVFASSNTGSVDRTEVGPLVVLDYQDGELVFATDDFLQTPVSNMLLRNFVVADFNNDGIDDLFLNNFGTEAISPFPGEQNRLLLSDGNGGYVDATANLPELSDTSHGSVAADFDGDGNVDIFVNNLGGAEGIPNYMLFGDGEGGFSAPQYAADRGVYERSDIFSSDFQTTGGYHPELIDYDGDGDFDIYFGRIRQYVDGTPFFVGFAYAENDGDGNFEVVYTDNFLGPLTPEIHEDRDFSSPEFTRYGDIDNDGDIDLVVMWSVFTDPAGTYFQYFDNAGLDGYVDVSTRIEGQHAGAMLQVLNGSPDFDLVDFDADGDLDIVSSRYGEEWSIQNTVWLENDGSGNFSQIDPGYFPATQIFEIADVNGDWIPDIVYQYGYWQVPFEAEEGNFIAVRYGEITSAVDRTGWGTDDRIAGGEFGDTLRGEGGSDELNGNGGDDFLYGGPGNDTLCGGDGDDTVFGEAGDDLIIGGSGEGNDAYDGGDDTDTLTYESTTLGVTVSLSAGTASGSEIDSDTIANIENVKGGSGADVISGNGSANLLEGLGGDDTLSAVGGSGNVLRGGLGNDTLIGGWGNDQLQGNSGADSFVGGTGADDFYIDSLDTSFDGGGGYDRIIVADTNGVNVALSGTNIERVIGGSGDDTFDGTGVTTSLVISGLGGNDTLTGGSAVDQISGGDDDDTLDGGDGGDFLFGDGGSDNFIGGKGDDRFFADSGDASFDGGEGYDRIFIQDTGSFVFSLAGTDVERVNGNDGNDVLDATGVTANITLAGGGGTDTLTGGDGNDVVAGQDGADIIEGGAGTDSLFGGADADTFVFNAGSGLDYIADWEDGSDKIDFSGYAAVDEFSDLTIIDNGGMTRIEFDGNAILVLGSTGEIEQSDFVFV